APPPSERNPRGTRSCAPPAQRVAPVAPCSATLRAAGATDYAWSQSVHLPGACFHGPPRRHESIAPATPRDDIRAPAARRVEETPRWTRPCTPPPTVPGPRHSTATASPPSVPPTSPSH